MRTAPLALAVALATLSPLIKTGQCPGGWSTSGNYCTPPPGATNPRNAIPKVGQCPSGYSQSGNYCEEVR